LFFATCVFGQAGRLVLSFSCECEPFKINWLRKAFPDTKVFTDMKDLHTGKAFDAKCQFMATVPKAMMFGKTRCSGSSPDFLNNPFPKLSADSYVFILFNRPHSFILSLVRLQPGRWML